MSAKCGDFLNALYLPQWTLSITWTSHRDVKCTDDYHRTSIMHRFVLPTHFAVWQLKDHSATTHRSFCLGHYLSLANSQQAEVPASISPSATVGTAVFPSSKSQFSLVRNYYYHVVITTSEVLGKFQSITYVTFVHLQILLWTATKHMPLLKTYFLPVPIICNGMITLWK